MSSFGYSTAEEAVKFMIVTSLLEIWCDDVNSEVRGDNTTPPICAPVDTGHSLMEQSSGHPIDIFKVFLLGPVHFNLRIPTSQIWLIWFLSIFQIYNKCHGQDTRKDGWAAVPWVTHRGSGPMRIVWRGRILIFYFKEFGECQSVCSRRILRSECETRTLLPYCCWPVAGGAGCRTLLVFDCLFLVWSEWSWLWWHDAIGIYGNTIAYSTHIYPNWGKMGETDKTQEEMRPYIFF